MKTTEQPMVHRETISSMSKPMRQDEGFGLSNNQPSPSRLSPLPIEWLDPDCWRLPSGKALAEFALQAGFLAPLMLGMPKPRRQPAASRSRRALDGNSAKPEAESRVDPVDESCPVPRDKMARPAAGSGKR